MTDHAIAGGEMDGAVASAAGALRSARRVTAICHENPDADTIGAAVAIARIARGLGKAAEVVSTDGVAAMYDFLGEDRIERLPRLAPDLVVVCDAATFERVGRLAVDRADWFEEARLLNVDHHVTNTGFGSINLVDPTASSTCEVVFSLLPELGIVPDAGLATALLTGIVRDSQGFADASTSPRTLRIVAQLMEAGASLADIHRRILGDLPFPTVALWGRILSTARRSTDGRIVAAALRPEMLEETGTKQHDADGAVEFLARSEGAEVALLLRAIGPSETRVSIRTGGRVDATLIAAAFGGGGHARRAGCTVAAALDAAVDQVIDASTATLSRLDDPTTSTATART